MPVGWAVRALTLACIRLLNGLLPLPCQSFRLDLGALLDMLGRAWVRWRGNQHTGTAVALNDLPRSDVRHTPLQPAPQEAVQQAAQSPPYRQPPGQLSLLADGPGTTTATTTILIIAQGEKEEGGCNDDHGAEEAGDQSPKRDAAVRATGHLAQRQGGDQPRLGAGEDAQLGREGVGGDGGIVGDDADDEEIAAPAVAERASREPAGEHGIPPLAQLVRVQQREDGRHQGVGEDLHVRPGPLAARAAGGADGQARLDIFLDVRGSRAGQEEDDQEHEGEVPRMRSTAHTLASRAGSHRPCPLSIAPT